MTSETLPLKSFAEQIPRSDSGELVTIVRYRYVIEAKVVSREGFDKINMLDPNEYWPTFDDAGEEDNGEEDNTRWREWILGGERELLPGTPSDAEYGFLVFDGNVAENIDDYISMMVGVNNWEEDFPLTIY